MKRITILLTVPLVFLAAAAFSPRALAASATWNNKTGAASYSGTTFVAWPVTTSKAGTTYVSQAAAKANGSKGFAPPNCPAALLTVAGNHKTGTYYTQKSSAVTALGCDYKKSTKVTFSNSYTYKSPTSNSSVLNGVDANGDTSSLQDDVQSTDPALDFNNSPCKDADHCNLTEKYINPFINFLAALAMIAVIIGVIWGAIEYTTSGGDPQRTASGKGKITNALVALAAFVFLYAFLQWLIPGGLL